MKTLLVIAPNNGLAAALRAVLKAENYRVLSHVDLREDELLLTAASVDGCVLDVDLTTIAPIRMIERVRKALPKAPLLLYTSDSHWAWEEDAYLLGVSYILDKPVRAKLLHSLLERLFAPAGPELPVTPPPARALASAHPPLEPRVSTRMLELLRNYSSLLTHSLCADSLLKEFLLLLREIVGINRAVIFLRPSATGLAADAGASRRLRSVCAIGLTPGLLEHFELTVESGIGGYVFRHGRLLRRDGAEAASDVQMQREFELLGAQVAIPVLDRECMLGVALLDGRVTGETLTNEELALIFHLLEQLGMAIKNTRVHDQISADHDMMSGIVKQLKDGCLVIGRDLKIWHANDIARRAFGRPHGAFEFNDLPQAIGSKVFETLHGGRPLVEFKHQAPTQPPTRYQVTITPFRQGGEATPSAALVMIEDCGPAERLRTLEIETANLRLVRQMAERLAHEIGNAVVPISTHQQLFKERAADPEFQESMGVAMEEGVKRVSRLVDQMRFLARDRMGKVEQVPVKQLIDEAFREARTHHPAATVLLQYESAEESMTVHCDRLGLQHAFAEIILNALQANTSSCQVLVRARSETDANGARWARIEVQDSGTGFSEEAADKGAEPFFTTRNVGLGLGLAVTNKIIQTHAGKLEIPAPRRGSSGLVRVSLPLAAAPT
ncbi:MAG TPA: ATP-binding protein [Verrucomicrobiae bacterium]|nr:ATP-binding protein [Verrucomicrobiae bacterium]